MTWHGMKSRNRNGHSHISHAPYPLFHPNEAVIPSYIKELGASVARIQ
jgi:hypothetical protein